MWYTRQNANCAGHPSLVLQERSSAISVFSLQQRCCWALKPTVKVSISDTSRVIHENLAVCCNAFAESEHAAGNKLKDADNLFENFAKSTLSKVDNTLPASKGDVQAAVQASDSILQAELDEYRNETTAVIHGLVGEVNALTPVGR